MGQAQNFLGVHMSFLEAKIVPTHTYIYTMMIISLFLILMLLYVVIELCFSLIAEVREAW